MPSNSPAVPESRRSGASAPRRLRILLVDDHALFRQSLSVLLTASGYEVIGAATDGIEALQGARTLRPDLILMDIEMPGCDGLAATRLIKAEIPEIKIVMLTVSSSDEHLFEAIKSGASGYLLKSQSADRFIEMISQVASGGAALSPELAARLLDEFARQARRTETPDAAQPGDLSSRAGRNLDAPGARRHLCANRRRAFLTEATVRYHMAQIMDRLHLENRAQVITYAARHGIGTH